MTATASDPPEALQPSEIYSVGYDSTTVDFFRARRAATHAAFFLPYVHPGMTLLDCGCGPGTITTDLAALVFPAIAVGIDRERHQLPLPLQQAAHRRVVQGHFAVADLYALPFPAATFDAVFLHGVLEHLRDPIAALCEVYRVLRRGGVVGARHADFGGFLLEPTPSPLDQFAEVFARLMAHNGADPQAGCHQIRWLRAAGFDRIVASASYDCWTRTPEETDRNATFLANLVGASAFATQLLETGIADRATLERMRQGFLAWGTQWHVFAAEAWGEAVAWQG